MDSISRPPPCPVRTAFFACDAVVTGSGCTRHIWKGTGGNSTFGETASDALRSNSGHTRVKRFDALKIRRAPALGGSTPPPGTKPQSRVGRGFQRYLSLQELTSNLEPKTVV
jgi:hypothetical protein